MPITFVVSLKFSANHTCVIIEVQCQSPMWYPWNSVPIINVVSLKFNVNHQCVVLEIQCQSYLCYHWNSVPITNVLSWKFSSNQTCVILEIQNKWLLCYLSKSKIIIIFVTSILSITKFLLQVTLKHTICNIYLTVHKGKKWCTI